MKLLIFSDIHDDWRALNRLMETEADYYVAAGDLTSWGRDLDKAGPILEQHGDRVYVMPGNHESEADVRRFCQQYNLRPLHGETFTAGKFQVAGLGCSPPTPFDTPGEYSEAELARRLTPFAELRPLILICHAPPLDTDLDRAAPGKHYGSSAVREFIDARQPDYFFCGHIHEAAGVNVALGKTKCWNVGKKGYLLTI